MLGSCVSYRSWRKEEGPGGPAWSKLAKTIQEWPAAQPICACKDHFLHDKSFCTQLRDTIRMINGYRDIADWSCESYRFFLNGCYCHGIADSSLTYSNKIMPRNNWEVSQCIVHYRNRVQCTAGIKAFLHHPL